MRSSWLTTAKPICGMRLPWCGSRRSWKSVVAAGEELTELTVDEILHKYRSAQDKFIVESFGTIAAYGGNAA